MNRQQVSRITDGISFVLALILTVGIRVLFHACAPKEDGSYMTCHWAEQAVFAMALAALILTAVTLVYRGKGHNGIKAGLCLGTTVISVLCALVPGVLIPLCMMQTMRCHTTMRPAITVLCVLLALSSLAGCFLHRSQCGMHHADKTVSSLGENAS